MDLLDAPVMPYAWGSHSALARVARRAPSGGPEAELWMGAHPKAPARITREGAERGLDGWITNDPGAELGPGCVARHGPRLPFLMKVLAAEQPLSIQAHPTREQAAAGFAREEAAGVPLGSPERRYVDAGDKPELLCALEPVDALVGLRDVGDAVRVVRAFGLEAEPGFRLVGGADHGGALRELLQLSRHERGRLVERVVLQSASCPSDLAEETGLVRRLAKLHPADVGVALALLLRRLHLAPLEAVFLPPRVLHAYLSGTGIELMASSDNVLRGGLTSKLVDPVELLGVIDPRPHAAPTLAAPPHGEAPAEYVWHTPVDAFRLSLVEPRGGVLELGRWGPEVFFCLDGPLHLESATGRWELTAGEAAFSAFRDGSLRASGAGARVFRATTCGPSPCPAPAVR